MNIIAKPVKNAPKRLSRPEACGLRHLAFRVTSVDETVKELNAKGIETEPVRFDTFTNKKMTFQLSAVSG